MQTARLIQPREIWTLGQERPSAAAIDEFKIKLLNWIEFNAINPDILKRNIDETENRFIDSMNAANFPTVYKYDMYSIYRTPTEQVQAYSDGWQAATESRHVLGKAGDIHIYKDGRRLRGQEMSEFYYTYIDGKLPDFDFTKLYDWGFHAHWEGDLSKKIAIGGVLLIAAVIYYMFKK
jgi:hypothetical protein